MDRELIWKPFRQDRLIRVNPNGFTVIRPAIRPEPVPLFCPICDLMMRTNDDAQKMREHGCCAKCSMKWAEPDLTRWSSGWRPASEEVSAEIKQRQAIPIGVKLDGAG